MNAKTLVCIGKNHGKPMMKWWWNNETIGSSDDFLILGLIIWNRGTCFVADIRMFVVEFNFSIGNTVDSSKPLRNNKNYWFVISYGHVVPHKVRWEDRIRVYPLTNVISQQNGPLLCLIPREHWIWLRAKIMTIPASGCWRHLQICL